MNNVRLFQPPVAQNKPPSIPKVQLEMQQRDGVDHINISTKGETELGRMLSHYYYSPFEHPCYGSFNCMEGFWHYIKSTKKDNKLRTLVGYRAKEYGRTLPEEPYQENFKQVIMDANFYKIEQNPKLQQLLIESTLPFDQYFYSETDQRIVRLTAIEWLVAGFEELRKMFKEGRRPKEVKCCQNCN